MEKIKLLIIGSGPGGYVAAIRAAQLGLNPVVIEKSELGGTCLNRGCIPTKALISAASAYKAIGQAKAFGITATAEFEWSKIVGYAQKTAQRSAKGVEFLFKKNGIRRIQATAEFIGPHTVKAGEHEFEAEHIIIATGSVVRDLPSIKRDGTQVIGSDEALFLSERPESLAIIGGGVIGVEIAYIYNAFGTKVTIIEALDRIVPFEEPEISKELTKELKRSKIKIHSGVFVTGMTQAESGVTLELGDGKTVEAEIVLSAVGRSPNLEPLSLSIAGVELTKRGFVAVDDQFCTNIAGVYAIGDVIETPMLAHTAEHEGITLVERLAGLNPHKIDYNLNPSCIYTEPAIAHLGLLEEEVKKREIEYTVGTFPYMANGKAQASNHTKGFVKVLMEKESHKLLGVHIIGFGATDLISEMVPAMAMGATADDIVTAIHPHPTLSEITLEAVLDALGRSLHK